MSVVYAIEFRIAPGQRDRFLELLNGVLDAMRHETSFETATLSVDPEDDHHFFLHEGWADHREVLEVQLARPYRSAWHDALDVILAEPRRISLWTAIRSDHASPCERLTASRN
jgi:quinol monooxygenase YgiN